MTPWPTQQPSDWAQTHVMEFWGPVVRVTSQFYSVTHVTASIKLVAFKKMFSEHFCFGTSHFNPIVYLPNRSSEQLSFIKMPVFGQRVFYLFLFKECCQFEIYLQFFLTLFFLLGKKHHLTAHFGLFIFIVLAL